MSVTNIVGVTNINTLRQNIISSTKSDLELLNSARLGTKDYEFPKLINQGGEADVFEVKSKIDGKIYAVKRL